MRLRLLAAVFAVSLAATAQTPMTVAELYSFVQSSQQFIKEGKMTDRELAGFLSKSKLTERLDDRAVEQLQGLGIGPKTLKPCTPARSIEDPDRGRADGAAGPAAAGSAAFLRGAGRHYRPRPGVRAVIQPAASGLHLHAGQRRFAAPAPGTRGGGRADSEPSFQLLDTLTSRVSYFEQKEEKKLVLNDNTLTTQDYKTLGGSTSTGEFGNMLREIFEYGTQARFEWDRWGTLRSRSRWYSPTTWTQAHSQWHIDSTAG